MSPTELAGYLKVLRDAGCMQARLILNGDAEIAVVLEPGLPDAVGTDPTPGGWKSPDKLDSMDAFTPEWADPSRPPDQQDDGSRR